jgi:hypothetical protein
VSTDTEDIKSSSLAEPRLNDNPSKRQLYIIVIVLFYAVLFMLILYFIFLRLKLLKFFFQRNVYLLQKIWPAQDLRDHRN